MTAVNPRGDKAIKLRNTDMARLLLEGRIDAALMGTDVILKEQLSGKLILPIIPTGFGQCQLRIGFPYKNGVPLDYESVKRTLENGLIATSMPEITTYLFNQSGIKITSDKLFLMSGSVEAGPDLEEKVVAVADLVATGNSIQAGNLRPDLALINFEAYLVTTKDKLIIF